MISNLQTMFAEDWWGTVALFVAAACAVRLFFTSNRFAMIFGGTAAAVIAIWLLDTRAGLWFGGVPRLTVAMLAAVFLVPGIWLMARDKARETKLPDGTN